MPADDKLIMVHTGRACSGKPGPDARAAWLICSGKARELNCSHPDSSNSATPLNECVNQLARRGLDESRASAWFTIIGEVS